MTNEKLDELERLLGAGTDGPWAVHPDGSVVAFTEQPLNFVVCSRIFPTDAALIVAAINALPELVAMAQELDAVRAELMDQAAAMVLLRAELADVRAKASALEAFEELASKPENSDEPVVYVMAIELAKLRAGLAEIKSAADSIVFEMDDDADDYIIRNAIRRLAAALAKDAPT